jgi:drug/metabolite transporter (DMT)-like permease
MANHSTAGIVETLRARLPLRDWLALVAAVILLTIAGSSLAAATASLASGNGDVAAVAVDSSAPGVAAASPSPLPGGDTDGDANDWTGTPLVFLALLGVVVIVAGVIIARYRSHQKSRQ